MNYYSLEQNVNAKMCMVSLIKRPVAIRQGRELLGAPRPLGGSQWLMNFKLQQKQYTSVGSLK